MYILGLSCFYHDSASCLLRDGEIVAACQEERFSRLKHDWRFPAESIGFCLEHAGITIDDIDHVCFYEKPLLKFERVIETFLSIAPRGFPSFVGTVPSWLTQKLWLPHLLSKKTGYRKKPLYAEHHLAHAASAFFASPFEEAAVLTVDGVGEWASAAYGHAKRNTVSLTHEMRFPHSLGLLYSAATSFLGFRVNHDEYKVMGMAAYGKPVFLPRITDRIVRMHPDGSIRLNLEFFEFQYGERMFNQARWQRLFGTPPRRPGDDFLQEHFDIAASFQSVTETVVMTMAEHVHRITKADCLCLAGGVALNSVANGKLLRNGPFKDMFIQPAAGDAGGAIGAAYAAYHQYLGKKDRHPLDNLYLGPSYANEEIASFLEAAGERFEKLPEDVLCAKVARLLAEGKVVGLFQGGMEFGPRALGNRSILADPRRPEMKDTINRKVKFREYFRPFAPAVLQEDAREYFSLDRPSPYMLVTAPVRSEKIPAVTHYDGSARVQTVARGTNPGLHALLTEFRKLTGVPVLLNTSLNIRGEPIAMTPSHALRAYRESAMDALALENCLLVKD
ncbi:MAG: carbamoyltransferase [Thermodesulfovibrionales bacterium]